MEIFFALKQNVGLCCVCVDFLTNSTIYSNCLFTSAQKDDTIKTVIISICFII